jgi:VRR-NUC domain
MSPEELARSGSEHGHQTALIAWKNKATRYGFSIADTMSEYKGPTAYTVGRVAPVPELELLLAIPNGGNRDSSTGARMKAEGALKGVPDLFLPVPCVYVTRGFSERTYCGLWIEMKTKKGRLSDEQKDILNKLHKQGYAVVKATSWHEAADFIKQYLNKDFEAISRFIYTIV